MEARQSAQGARSQESMNRSGDVTALPYNTDGDLGVCADPVPRLPLAVRRVIEISRVLRGIAASLGVV